MSPSFSERHGYTPARESFQIESADEALRSNLWNVAAGHFIGDDQFTSDSAPGFFEALYHGFDRRPVDDIHPFTTNERKKLKTFFLTCEWHRLYDLLEFLVQPRMTAYLQMGSMQDVITGFNAALEANGAGYRLIDGLVTPITDETELGAIDDALRLGDKFAPARAHIKAALELYSDRANPDYRNAIKEAVSAVESVARLATGQQKAGKALDELVASFKLHPALTEALKKIYGYTSDGDGIRHALLKDSDADAPLAKFMIIACSAFVSYVVEKTAV